MTELNNPHFYRFLAEANIVCNIEAETSQELIRKLAERLSKTTPGLDKEKIIAAVIARENIVPTVIAPGLAVPHARMDGVDHLLVALGTSVRGIDFNSPGMPPVKIAVLILTPKSDPGLHIQVLSALAKDFADQDKIERVAALDDAAAILEYFTTGALKLPSFVRARDLMTRKPLTLQESDTLKTVIDTFAAKQVKTIPVVDGDGDLCGIVALEDILRFSLPEHLLWMNDLSSIYRFQPFADMLKSDNETKLADFMSNDMITVDIDIPAVQLAKLFIVHKVDQIIVLDKGKLAGVVNIKDFVLKLFWE
ncbi:MAG: PTS sugar transporter subunit IIA [Victivallales bacterium]|nr:PTS sugar transporter subunit IIA [Victivallales bacterium]